MPLAPPAAPPRREDLAAGYAIARRWRAMGTDCHAVAVDPDPARATAALATVVALVDDLERRWSRFRPDSELCRLNAAAGRPVVVTDETLAVVCAAIDGRARTGGRFDPVVLGPLLALGYDRDFDSLPSAPRGARDLASTPAAGSERRRAGGEVEVDLDRGTVRVVGGALLDLGGVAKGYAADLAALAARGAGVHGALVNLGGDLRAVGTGPTGAWGVEVDDPARPGRRLGHLALLDGAVVTSSIARRRWRAGDGRVVHHVLDPRTGEPAASDLVSATVVHGTAAAAEVLATAALVGGHAWATTAVAAEGAAALLVDRTGAVHHAGPVEAFLR